ncbi:hypothetical protein KC717_05145 [Candidatus Dojkabacteria bacterium]|uniref:Uncharacterized protein n=1 Tax=Candidatus Dojkabacteria bacterium TaxID=2099670 RepID=A0A955RKP3_9BACT|nr:hypothetical protein [Candidatus Dojkabacteria bacterium]
MKTNLYIFEGITTSGKTSIVASLEGLIRRAGDSVKIVSEDETFLPVFTEKEVDNLGRHAYRVLEKLISISQRGVNSILVERFLLSYSYKSRTSIGNFQQLELLLLQHFNPMYVLLKLEEGKIWQSIQGAFEHRGGDWSGKAPGINSWEEYILSKGSIGEIVEYYSEQQNNFMHNGGKSLIPLCIIDANSKDYKMLAQDIALEYQICKIGE